jgi:hypothetical protein
MILALVAAAGPARAAPPAKPSPQPLWRAYPLDSSGRGKNGGARPRPAATTPSRGNHAPATSSSRALEVIGGALAAAFVLALGLMLTRRRHASAEGRRRRPEVSAVEKQPARTNGSQRPADVGALDLGFTAERSADREVGREPGPVSELLESLSRYGYGSETGGAETNGELSEVSDQTKPLPKRSHEDDVETLKTKQRATPAPSDAQSVDELKLKLASQNRTAANEAETLKAKLEAANALAPAPGSELLESRRHAADEPARREPPDLREADAAEAVEIAEATELRAASIPAAESGTRSRRLGFISRAWILNVSWSVLAIALAVVIVYLWMRG